MVAVYITAICLQASTCTCGWTKLFPYPVICFFLIKTTLAFTTSPGMMSAKAVEPYVGGRLH